MPRPFEQLTAWIDSQQERLLGLVWDWAGISSHSLDPAGLGRMRARLIEDFVPLGRLAGNAVGRRLVVDASGNEVSEPVGEILSLRHEAATGPRVLLAIHYDTVYPADAEPRQVSLSDDGQLLRGPGVTDAKGGLAVLLVALEAFQRVGQTDRLSWEVLLNADEEL
ncbi:MAG: M20/M25/M40 family metallo-hydrolase, partial [Pirellulales bacterium]